MMIMMMMMMMMKWQKKQNNLISLYSEVKGVQLHFVHHWRSDVSVAIEYITRSCVYDHMCTRSVLQCNCYSPTPIHRVYVFCMTIIHNELMLES